MTNTHALKRLSDDELLCRLSSLLHDSRRVEAELIAHIAEVDARRLYAREATSSMFRYCIERLHLSEGEAFLRIQVARATLKHPILLDMLADGRLHLSGIGKLAPHLTSRNRGELLKRATHRSKREIEELVAELQPRPDVPASVRKLPARPTRPDEVGALGAERLLVAEPVGKGELRPDEVERPAVARAMPLAPIQPLAPERYKVQFTASVEFRKKLEQLQALLPDADLAEIIEAAVTEKLERLEARRFGRAKTPRQTLAKSDTSASSRYIPAAARRVVHERDGGQCAFVDSRGRRCKARERLEFHHCQPFGLQGDHSPENLQLLCRAHNAHLAEQDYGQEKMASYRRPRDSVSDVGPTR